jgi:uncharacterized lipoprotein YmbA
LADQLAQTCNPNRLTRKKNNMQKPLILVISMLLMSCITTGPAPDIRYYLFDAEPPVQKEKAARLIIELKDVKLPDYLSTNQLVMLDSEHILIKANYHSWADSLDESIQRALVNDLNNLSKDKEFVAGCENCKKSASLSVTVEHFYPSTGGKLLLSGSFEFMDPQNENQLTRFQLLNELDSDGYANAVKQMRAQVSDLAESIIAAIDNE